MQRHTGIKIFKYQGFTLGMWLKSLPLVVIVILSGVIAAQTPGKSNKFLFKGSVADHRTRAPIRGVNISVEGSRRGCTTNDDGGFLLTIYTRPAYLKVSHVGYETQRIFIDHSTKQISILLNPVMQTLPDVEIRAKNDPLPFFKDRKYSVLDYEVVDRQVYLLVYLSILKSPQLLCKTFDGDTVARSQPLPIKPKGLFRDCLGNIHVLDNDSAYQVCKHGDILTLCYSSGLDRFNAFLADCVTATDSVLYFRKESPDQLSVEFYQVNRFNNRRLLLAALGDEEKQRMMRRNPGDYELLTMKTPPRNIEQAVAWQWLKKVVYLNNSSSLNRVDDLLCIINTTEHTLELYTLGGAFTSRLKIPIEEGGATHWTKDMFVDPVRHKLYTSFLKSGGNFFLYNIDLNTGALRQTIRAEHAFPQKVRIQGNYLFYMYDIPGEGDNRHLFRQKF